MTRRPSKYDADIQGKVADSFAEELESWATWSWPDAASSLMDAMRDVYPYDGYKLAKRLEEQACIDADEWLVDLLSGVDAKANSIAIQAAIDWLPTSGLTPPAIGSRVKTDYAEGVVVKNWPEGRSTVFCSSLGHVGDEQMGTHGLIVEWERLTQIEEGGAR